MPEPDPVAPPPRPPSATTAQATTHGPAPTAGASGNTASGNTASGSTAAEGPAAASRSSSAGSEAPGGKPSLGGSDWPAQATGTIVGLVGSVRDKTTGPASSLVRGVVYGTLAAIVGTAALVLALVLLLRAIDVGVDALLDLADLDRRGRSTWIAHALLGLPLLLAGLWCWGKGRRATVD